VTAHFVEVHPLLRSLADIAENQDGVVSREDATNLDVSRLQVQRWVDRGQLERIGRRSLTFPGAPRTSRFDLRVALNDAGPGAVVSHRSAACLHGFDGFGEGSVDVLVLRAYKGRKVLGTVHSTAHLPNIDRCWADGLPCTSPARTVLDLAGLVRRQDLENAVDSAIRNGGCSQAFLLSRFFKLRYRGFVGASLLDEILVDAGGANRLERRFLALCRTAHLPRPSCQIRHARRGQPVARVDFDFAPSALIVEVEGQVGHASPRQRQRDAERRRDLMHLGRIVISFTFEDVFARPGMVIGATRDSLNLALAS
jgi:Protein of unknown function (DUF559)